MHSHSQWQSISLAVAITTFTEAALLCQTKTDRFNQFSRSQNLFNLLRQDIFPQFKMYLHSLWVCVCVYVYIYTYTDSCNLIHMHINVYITCHSHCHQQFSSVHPFYQVTKAWHSLSSLKCLVAGVFLATWNGSKPSLSLSVTSPPCIPAGLVYQSCTVWKIQQESSMA